MPTADTFCMNLHLMEISRSVDEKVHVVLLLDQAGWHLSKSLHVPGNISLLPLPAYSPELNPIELVWLYLKSHYLSNRVYANREILYEAGVEAWNRLTSDVQRLMSLCNVPWICSAN
jgi:transposase